MIYITVVGVNTKLSVSQGDSYGLAGISNHVFANYFPLRDIPLHHPKRAEWSANMDASEADAAYVILAINLLSDDSEQDWFLDAHGQLRSLVLMKAECDWLTTCTVVWSDGAPNYHNSISIALLPQFKELTGISVLARGFSEPGHGKNKCDALTNQTVRQWVCVVRWRGRMHVHAVNTC